MRVAIVNAIGIPTDEWNLYMGRADFEKLQEHPIYPLINHSDCDGSLSRQELKKIVPVLEAVIPNIPDEKMQAFTKQFLRSCNLALDANEPLLFV